MTRLSVPDISCGHCKAAIETALAALPDTGAISVDVSARQVEIAGSASPKSLISALMQIGYPATVISAS